MNESNAIKWRNLSEEKPYDGQLCLTKMKHGIISGYYSAKDNDFGAYYWRDMEWFGTYWVPFEEVE